MTHYARQVLSGKIVAGRPVRLACERHLRDLAKQSETGMRFDRELARRAIAFFEEMLEIEAGSRTRPFVLEPWQRFIVGSVFGWLNADGTRRFRTAYVEVAKGNGKTPLAAGVGLYGLVADGEASPEIYSAAVTADQARICWKDAAAMVLRSPELRSAIEDRVASLYCPANGGIFRPVSSEHRGLDGKRVHMAIIDELHEHPTPLVVDKMRAGTKARRNALIFEITNSGSDLESVCAKHHEYSLKVLEGALDDPGWFAYVSALDEGDDWQDEKVWVKANPGLGTILPVRYLREQVREAQGMPTKQNIVKRLNFNIWTEQHTVWIPQDWWAACDEPIDPESLLDRPCWVGLDLSSKLDLTALVLAFRREAETAVSLEVPEPAPGGVQPRRKVLDLNFSVDLVPFFYIPEETMYERERADRVPYSLWARQGYIHPTPGNIIDYDFIYEHFTSEIAPRYSVEEIGYDPYNATSFALELQAAGYRVVEVRQGVLTMSEPAKVFEALVRARRIRHGGHPVLRWNISNVAVREDKKGNIFPYKQQERKRIDGVIAAVIALSRLMAARGEAPVSVYDERPSFLQL